MNYFGYCNTIISFATLDVFNHCIITTSSNHVSRIKSAKYKWGYQICIIDINIPRIIHFILVIESNIEAYQISNNNIHTSLLFKLLMLTGEPTIKSFIYIDRQDRWCKYLISIWTVGDEASTATDILLCLATGQNKDLVTEVLKTFRVIFLCKYTLFFNKILTHKANQHD